MADIYVDDAINMKHGDRRLLSNGRIEIGVFRIGESFHAFQNVCPHQGGPVCQGKVMPKVEECISSEGKSVRMEFSNNQFHLVCPWHGYEFKFETGTHPGSKDIRIRSFPVRIVEGKVYVTV